MKFNTIITSTLGLLLVLFTAGCQRNEGGNTDGAAASAKPVLPTDVDLGHGYVRRDGAIHFIGGGTTGTGANATRIDTPSPELLKKVVDSKFGPFQTAEGLDAASFEALSETYTRDKDRVYYKVISSGEFLVILLPDADPASFEILTGSLTRDRNHVWFYHQIQPGADPSTVEVINDSFSVFKDKDSVHYGAEQVDGADPVSFEQIGSAYYRDKNRVYWGPDPIPDANPSTFEVLGGSFIGKDKSSIYRSGALLSGFDAGSFKLILHDPAGYQFLSDKHGIYLNQMIFPRSKPAKTKVIDNLTVQAGDLVHLVSTHQFTPVTVFKEDGKVMAEAPCYEPTSRKALGRITAQVTEDGLKNIQALPLPGQSKIPQVPDWQLGALKRQDLVQRMIKAGKLIK